MSGVFNRVHYQSNTILTLYGAQIQTFFKKVSLSKKFEHDIKYRWAIINVYTFNFKRFSLRRICNGINGNFSDSVQKSLVTTDLTFMSTVSLLLPICASFITVSVVYPQYKLAHCYVTALFRGCC